MEFTTHFELHSQTTRLVGAVVKSPKDPRGYHPRWRLFPKNLGPEGYYRPPNYNASDEAFKFELLPLHSPLLRQSLLVSFPPLIDMLKFSG